MTCQCVVGCVVVEVGVLEVGIFWGGVPYIIDGEERSSSCRFVVLPFVSPGTFSKV